MIYLLLKLFLICFYIRNLMIMISWVNYVASA